MLVTTIRFPPSGNGSLFLVVRLSLSRAGRIPAAANLIFIIWPITPALVLIG